MSRRLASRVRAAIDRFLELPKYANGNVRNLSVWTPEKIVKSPYKDIEIPNCTLFDYVFQNLEKWPERTAMVCGETGRGYTYEQVFKLTVAFAANLRRKLKIRDGDSIAVMLPNIPEYPIVALGISEAGGIITTINPVYTAYEVQRQLLMSDARLIITLPEITNVVKDALAIAKLDIPIIVVKTNKNNDQTPTGTILYNELSEDLSVDKSCLKDVKRNNDDLCLMPYSSGTTGLPKGVELTHKSIVSNCEQINEPLIRCHNETTGTHQDAVMAILPFFHIYGGTVVMFHKLSLGIKIVTLPKFQPESYLKAIEKYKTNVVFVAPPLVLLMTNHPAAGPKTYQYLDIFINGAAPLAAADAERFMEKAQRRMDFRQGYGLTETSPVVALTPKGLNDYSCVGYAIPNTELKIVDDKLNSLGPNEKGELLVRGPQVMRGYRNNPNANAECFTADGWLRTGDLAVVHKDGIMTIHDRLKELIKVKGFQVPPAELEAVLREHPAVMDAAVIGVPHPITGEAPKAFVVLKKDFNVIADDITNFVKSRVAPFKRIDDVVFLDSIPKSISGKILRRELKERYCQY